MDDLSSLMMYSILGGDEQEYEKTLKADVVNARLELLAVLLKWNDKGIKLQVAMDKTKYDALEYDQAQKVVEWASQIQV